MRIFLEQDYFAPETRDFRRRGESRAAAADDHDVGECCFSQLPLRTWFAVRPFALMYRRANRFSREQRRSCFYTSARTGLVSLQIVNLGKINVLPRRHLGLDRAYLEHEVR